MKFLVLLSPAQGKAAEEFKPHMMPELESVWASYADDKLREFYFSKEAKIVTLIYELPSLEAVQTAVKDLPLVKVDLLDYQIVHMGPFQQLSALFADKTAI